MAKFQTTNFHLITALIVMLGLVLLAGCSSMKQMAKEQDQYNQEKCRQYGLYPGSSAYVDCVSSGADVYAQQHKDRGGYDRPWGSSRDRSNSCDAPASPSKSCASCSVSCGSDKQAFCKQGEEWPGGSPTCMRNAVCECR